MARSTASVRSIVRRVRVYAQAAGHRCSYSPAHRGRCPAGDRREVHAAWQWLIDTRCLQTSRRLCGPCRSDDPQRADRAAVVGVVGPGADMRVKSRRAKARLIDTITEWSPWTTRSRRRQVRIQ